jgi:hypothetical protein
MAGTVVGLTRQVLVVLPGAMTVRNWLSTDVARRLGQTKTLSVTLVTPDAADQPAALAAGLAWRPLLRSAGGRLGPRLLAGYLLHQAIVFRFNALAGLWGAEQRLRQSWTLRRIAIKDGIPASRWFGRPFPRSHRLYDWMCRLYYAGWQRHASVERLFDETKPDLLVLGHAQTHFSTPYALAAAARCVPILGAIGSWDQPTTKGPLSPGVRRFLVQSQAVADDVVRYHAVPREAIDVVGWVQMDLYFGDSSKAGREATLAELGLPADARYILVGSSPERLGHNEPAICNWLAADLAKRFGASLVIRCHPNDRKWQRRFGPLHRPPHVIALPPEFGRMDRMANQIRHAAAVISPAGSILLDAVGLDTPAIGLAFENDDEPYYDRLARRYDMEHLRYLAETGGVVLARNHDDLAAYVAEGLMDRDRNGGKRARLRAKYLDPLDGRSAERVVAAIVREVGSVRTPSPDSVRVP